MFKRDYIHKIQDRDSFFSLTNLDFEWCCKFLLEEKCCAKVYVTTKGKKGGDGGVDLKVYSAERKPAVYVQSKLWKSRYGGLMKPIRELAGCMKRDNVQKGIFMITTEATPQEQAEAYKLDIEIIDINELLHLAKRLQEKTVPHPFNGNDESSNGLAFLVMFGMFIVFVIFGIANYL